MSSLFDRINKVVGDLTKKVEESGVVDELKDLVGSKSPEPETASASEAAAAGRSGSASGDRPHSWEGAVGRAGVDPMTLLTPAEAGAAVGLPLDNSHEQLDDEWFGVTWSASPGPYVEARFTHGYSDGSPVDLEAMWGFVTLEVGATKPVDVDDRVDARADDMDSLYVRTPSHIFYVVSGGLPEGTEAAAVHQAAARAVVDKLLG